MILKSIFLSDRENCYIMCNFYFFDNADLYTLQISICLNNFRVTQSRTRYPGTTEDKHKTGLSKRAPVQFLLIPFNLL